MITNSKEKRIFLWNAIKVSITIRFFFLIWRYVAWYECILSEWISQCCLTFQWVFFSVLWHHVLSMVTYGVQCTYTQSLRPVCIIFCIIIYYAIMFLFMSILFNVQRSAHVFITRQRTEISFSIFFFLISFDFVAHRPR